MTEKIKLTPAIQHAMVTLSRAQGSAMRAEGLSQEQMDRIAERVMDAMDDEIDDQYVHIASVRLATQGE